MNDKYYKTFVDNKLKVGRLIYFSKSEYRKLFPERKRVFFNANVITEDDGKIWYGDLDLDVDEEILNKISKEINKKIYVLKEMDCRFDDENSDIKKLINKSVWESE